MLKRGLHASASQMRKVIALGLTLIFMIVLFCGCAWFQPPAEPQVEEHAADQTTGFRRTVLYYQTDDGFMVPVVKLLPWEEGIGRAALNQLIDTEENRTASAPMGLKNVVPPGVTFVLRIADDAVATVDIQGLPKLESAEAEQALVCAVVNTLTEFSTIDQVKLTFDGKTLKKLPNGTRVKDAMRAIPLNQEPLTVTADADDLNRMTLFFANQAASLYVPVTRMVEREPSLLLAMEELVSGPVEAALRSCFPEGVEVISASIVDDVAWVNFSKEFGDLAGTPVFEEMAMETMQLTAQQFGAISALHVQVDGEDYQSAAMENMAMPTFVNEFR